MKCYFWFDTLDIHKLFWILINLCRVKIGKKEPPYYLNQWSLVFYKTSLGDQNLSEKSVNYSL